MRARFVFEKFNEEGDPIHDMGIGKIDIITEIRKMYTNKDTNYVSEETFKEIYKFLDLFLNKKIEGKFKTEFYETIVKTTIVPISYITYLGGSIVKFINKSRAEYEVIPGETYMISNVNESFSEERDTIHDIDIYK